jgi:hypothetical protein
MLAAHRHPGARLESGDPHTGRIDMLGLRQGGLMNAAETYRARLNEVRDLIRKLEGSLLIHERRAAAAPGNWGFPGDLGHIAERLREITPNHQDRRCEWKHPKTCGEHAAYCLPDGRLVCHEHAPESGSDPRVCLDLESGLPADQD